MSQNFQNIPKPMNRNGKQPTSLLSGGKAVAAPTCSEKSFAGFESFVRKKIISKSFILFILSLVLLTASCKTKEVPGRRRTPRHCNTCTKWSYTPQEAIEYELLHNDEG